MHLRLMKKLGTQKTHPLNLVVEDESNLASFYDSHIDGIVCVKQIDLGLART